MDLTYSRRLLRLLRPALVLGLLVALYLAGGMAQARLSDLLMALQGPLGQVALWGGLALYVLLMALPFVPGMEISLMLMLLFGVEGIVLVYLGTLAALCSSYAAGHLLPLPRVAALLGWLRLNRGRDFVQSLEHRTQEEILELLTARLPLRSREKVMRYRYLVIALALNLPGNSFIGGGGGIALVAGLCRVFRFPAFLLTVALAIAPLPTVLLAAALFSSG